MKRVLYSLPLAVALLFSMQSHQPVQAATSSGNNLVIPDTLGKLKVPQNTTCRKIDYQNDANRIEPDSRTVFSGRDSKGELITDIYDLCIGSYPRFPSTSVEGGVEPYYYLKYTLLPDPMPIYTITTTPLKIHNSEIVGVNQEFKVNKDYEAKDKASDGDIFLSYPYDSNHTNTAPTPSSHIKGPYQIGYNSFYHNTYRARYFASQVKFDFQVLEPKKDSEVAGVDGEKYEDKTTLFSGTIIYDIPDSCYEEEYLDYKDSCRNIEFYFPKGTKTKEYTGDRNTDTYTGSVKNETDVDKTSKNVIPKERTAYMNPGQHDLVVKVTENTQLRVQKDIGTEYQTIGRQEGNIAYFKRTDKDITGASIAPLTSITQLASHNGKTASNSGRTITDNAGNGEFTYDMEKNTDWDNYCYEETYSYEVDGETKYNTETICNNQPSAYRHFWQYNWSKTGWYATNPRPSLN
ncbi:hypothetical protein U8V72_18365 [Priestia filamentosa]|uniref:hypothetical protein n=1 Tax=Priestia filamentosa TaxID=1402861 RepID=UPI00397DADD7